MTTRKRMVRNSCDIYQIRSGNVGGVPLDERSGGHVIDMILDEMLSDSDDEEMGRRRIRTPAVRMKRGISKKYVRPIFKEPGSKLPSKTSQIDDYERRHATTVPTAYWNSEKKSNIAYPTLYRFPAYYSSMTENENQVIQPALHRETRLEYIAGTPGERYSYSNADSPITIRTRLLRKLTRLQQSYKRNSDSDFGDCGSSVGTLSDLENLEAKPLFGRNDPLPKNDRSNLNSFRQEINRIVTSSSVRRDSHQVRKRIWLRRVGDNGQSLADDEEREEPAPKKSNEGCTSNGCAFFLEEGIRSGMQDIINDVKNYWKG